MHNRDRMRASNRRAVEYLLEEGFDQIWLKAHSARNDVVYTRRGTYLATDLWNLFDGICFGGVTPFYLQIKTNAWAKTEPIIKFQNHHAVDAIIINVTNRTGKWEVKAKLLEAYR